MQYNELITYKIYEFTEGVELRKLAKLPLKFSNDLLYLSHRDESTFDCLTLQQTQTQYLLMMTKHLTLFVFLFFLCGQAYGQKYNVKNFDLEGDIDAWFSARYDSVSIRPIIGPLVIVSPPRPTTNSFFIENIRGWVDASLIYDRQSYTSIRLKYDIEQQIIYTPHPINLQPIALDQRLVNKFTTPIGTFKPRENAKGYYLVIYDGENHELIKESEKRLIIDDRVFEYARTDEMYLMKGSEKIRIRKANSFLKIFPNSKKEIKKHMRTKTSRALKRENKEAFLVQIAQYCDNLSDR